MNDSKFLKKKEIKPKKNKLYSFFNKVLICFILGITCLIIMKQNPSFKSFIKTKVFKDNLSFAYLNNLYNKYFGDVLPSYKTEEEMPVFKEQLEYNSYNKYYDGYILGVSKNYLIPIIESGIVVFSGEMENYGKVVIIEGIDGVDIWYGNIENSNVKLYDYVNKGDFLGEVENNNLYLVLEKNKEYISFEEYFKN